MVISCRRHWLFTVCIQLVQSAGRKRSARFALKKISPWHRVNKRLSFLYLLFKVCLTSETFAPTNLLHQQQDEDSFIRIRPFYRSLDVACGNTHCRKYGMSDSHSDHPNWQVRYESRTDRTDKKTWRRSNRSFQKKHSSPKRVKDTTKTSPVWRGLQRTAVPALFTNTLETTAESPESCTRQTATCVLQITFWRRNYFFFNFSTPVYKMWIIQEPNMSELWNKLHFEEKKRTVYTMFKAFGTYICWINI